MESKYKVAKNEKRSQVKYLKIVLYLKKMFLPTTKYSFLYCVLFAAINAELIGEHDGNVQLCRSEGDPM